MGKNKLSRNSSLEPCSQDMNSIDFGTPLLKESYFEIFQGVGFDV